MGQMSGIADKNIDVMYFCIQDFPNNDQIQHLNVLYFDISLTVFFPLTCPPTEFMASLNSKTEMIVTTFPNPLAESFLTIAHSVDGEHIEHCPSFCLMCIIYFGQLPIVLTQCRILFCLTF